MGDELKYLKTRNEEYPFIYSLNVMNALQNKYGSLNAWSELLETTDKEPSIDAILFFFKEAINEGIDIENEKKHTQRDFVSQKKVGRIISEIGIEEAGKQLRNAIVSSIQDKGESNNSKNQRPTETLN